MFHKIIISYVMHSFFFWSQDVAVIDDSNAELYGAATACSK